MSKLAEIAEEEDSVEPNDSKHSQILDKSLINEDQK